jgi:hypothetical protein
VRKVSSDTDIADAILGFHAQQAAEKLIKAVLVARGVAFIRATRCGHGQKVRSRPRNGHKTPGNQTQTNRSRARS